jgi:hypothetical protein
MVNLGLPCLSSGDVLLEEVQVIDPCDFGRAFAEPTIDLVDPRVDADEVNAREMHLATILVDSPVDVDSRVYEVILLVVYVAVAELEEDIVAPYTTLVSSVLWKACTTEGELISFDPLGVIGLAMEGILREPT